MSVSILESALVVGARRQLTEEVVELMLHRPDGAALPAWTPGAHIDLLLADGLTRQYSLSGEPGADHWRIAVLREDAGRGGSAMVHEQLVEGAAITVRGPHNHFELHPAPSYRFLAGGIGITPLLPMLAAAEAQGADWSLDYAGRSRSTMAYLPELLERHGDRIRVHAADEGARLDLDAWLPASEAPVYVCGPARLLDAVTAATSGWAEGRVRMERFEARELGEPVISGSFEVDFAISGVTAEVGPDETILDVAEANGLFVLSSCREGTCGTCETPIIEGEADHRDSILSPAEQAENRVMMICVSRAACPRLVLEL